MTVRARLRGRHVPSLVLLLVVILTLLVSFVVNLFVREQQRSRFEREAGAYAQGLQDRVLVYERLLEAMRSGWTTGPSLREDDFARYVGGLDLARRYPGVQAVGFGVWTPRAQVASLTAQLRRTVSPSYAVRPDVSAPGGPTASGAAAFHVPVALIAPRSARNLRVLGFDLYSEAVRRASLDAARRGDHVQASGLIHLVQPDASGQRPLGFLMSIPVRDAAGLRGFLFLAVQGAAFTGGLNVPQKKSGELLVDVNLNGQSLLSPPPALDALPFRTVTPVSLVGQDWTVNFGARSDFGRDEAALVPYLMALLGLVIAGGAFMIVKGQVDARTRAERLNVSLSRARHLQDESRAEFESIFQSMQDGAAFADASGRIRLVNRALARALQVPAPALGGRTLGELHVDQRLSGASTFALLSTNYRRADGTAFMGEAQRSEVRGPDGQLLGLLEVLRDVSERVNVERALQAGERRSRAVLDAVPHIVWVASPDGEVTYRNEQHARLLGGADLTDRLDDRDRAAYARMQAESLDSGGDAQCEVRLRVRGSQEPRWFVIRVTPVREDQNHVTGWVTSATDIHDRLLAERLAQRNEERYRGVLEGMPQIVWLTDLDGGPQYFNRRWEEYVGLTRAGQGFLSLLHPDDREEYQRRWGSALQHTRPFESEHRLLGADGQYRTFVTRGLPVRDAQGRTLEWVGTSTDVDDQVYAEQTARLLADVSEQLTARSEDSSHLRHDRYRAALARLGSRFVDSGALWTVNPTQLVAAASPGASWHAAALQVVAGQAIERVLATEDPVFIEAEPGLHRVGVTGALFYPLIGRDSAPVGVLGLLYRQALTARDQDFAQDLAQRFASALGNDRLQERVLAAQEALRQLNHSLEERVRQRTLELEAANRELEAFSYSVSHDLRTPLRHIVGFGDLLHKESGDGLSVKGQRYLSVMKESATRMGQLIDDLLSFSRMGRQELRHTPVNLGAVLTSSWKALEPDRQGRDVRFVLPGDLPTVKGDEPLLTLAFTNLLSNALKYSRGVPHALIEVSAQVSEHEVTVNIRDNGVGFDPRYTDKLFGVFQRLHRADEFEGIGIGLANVRRIVGRHGGSVAALGNPGQGATFSVTLPLRGPS